MSPMLGWFVAQGVPPEIVGLPTWVLNGLSIGSLISLVLMGLATGRLWTQGQVNRLIEQHNESMKVMQTRWETHLARTAELHQSRVDDAVRREGEWKDIASRWQQVSEILGGSIDPLQDASATTLEIVRQMQAFQLASSPPRPGRTR